MTSLIYKPSSLEFGAIHYAVLQEMERFITRHARDVPVAGLQQLRSDGSPILNLYDALTLEGFLRASKLKWRLKYFINGTSIESQWTIMHRAV